MRCKRLTHAGITEFIDYVDRCHNEGIHHPFPDKILTDPDFSEYIPGNWEIDPQKIFQNRYEMADYIFQQLGKEFVLKYYDDVGIWSWFAAVYFDQFCPPDQKVKRREHYILSLGDYMVRESVMPVDYRHCVRTPVYVVCEIPEIAKAIILGSKNKDSLYEMGDSLEQFMSRKFLYKCIPYQDLIKHLYVTPDGLAKPGYTSKPAKQKNKKGKWSKAGYGGIRRLVTVLPRLKIAYNLRDMLPSDIVEKAGREFQKWES